MATTLDISTLSLEQVHQYLKLQRQVGTSLNSQLSLIPLTDQDQQDLHKISTYFYEHYAASKINEGEVKFLVLSPLLWTAGFYCSEFKISLEENIAPIYVDDGDTHLRGRMDILISTRTKDNITSHPLWILLIEAKNSEVNASAGLPQLLTYAYKSLAQQFSTWGLTTNGMDFQFVLLEAGDPPTYQLFPKLDLTQPEQAMQLLQVLKAIAHE